VKIQYYFKLTFKIYVKEFNNINSVLSYFCLSNIPFTSKSISLYHCYYTESNLHKKIRQSLWLPDLFLENLQF